MKIITKQSIDSDLKALWDSVILIPDQEVKEFAAARVAAKEKELKSKLEAQKQLLALLDEDFVEDISLFDDEEVYETLLKNTDEETADEVSDKLAKFINLLKICL